MDSRGVIELDQFEAEKIISAMLMMRDLNIFEDCLYAIYENYSDLQIKLFRQIMERQLYSPLFQDQYYDVFREPGRIILALLASVRAYQDLSAKHLINWLPNDWLKLLKKSKYDNSLAYQFCEEFRNYTQHKGVPVQSYISTNSWNSEMNQRVSSVKLPIRMEKIISLGGFKKRILDEIAEIGSEVCLNDYLSDYVSLISEIHADIRNEVAEKVRESGVQITGTISDYKSNFSESSSGIYIFERHNEVEVRRVAVYSEPFDRYDRLCKTVKAPVNLGALAVSPRSLKL